VHTLPEQVFVHLDDQTRLSAHMNKRSWKMAWGKLETLLDSQRGRAVGSHIGLRGRVLGLTLYLDEVVIAREAPERKTWATVGEPRLLVIGSYRMGFSLERRDPGFSSLRVEIDYDLPERGFSRFLGWLFGKSYAKWCTRRMVVDAQRAFT
jgi:hypothetical protein